MNCLVSSCFPLLFLLTAAAWSPNWNTVNIRDVQNAIRNGVTCETIIKTFLDRIKQFEKNPGLGGMIYVNDNALELSKERDVYYRDKRELIGPLHCVPVIAKDNIDVANLPSSAGLRALNQSIPSIHSDIILSILNAGGVILGKANMSPFALESRFTTSETGGPARNPYDPKRTVWGSSGGNAVSGAAVYGLVGLATDTGGSIMMPASATGLIGLRPTWNNISIKGIVPLNALQDTVGPMVRWAEDLALVMDAIDPMASRSMTPLYNNSRVLDENGLNGTRIAIFKELTYTGFEFPAGPNKTLSFNPTSEMLVLVSNAVHNMQVAGANVQNVSLDVRAVTPYFLQLLTLWGNLSFCNVRWMDEYFSNSQRFGPQAPFHSFLDFKNSIQRKNSPLLPSNFSESFEKDYQNQNQCSQTIQQYMIARQQFNAKVIETLFASTQADLVLYLTTDSFPENEDSPVSRITGTILAALSGFPSMELPIGFSPSSANGASQGLPAGVILLARPDRMDLLVKVAYAYQKRFGETKLPWSVSSAARYHYSIGVMLIWFVRGLFI